MLSTLTKINAARVLYRMLKLAGLRDDQVVTRSGVRFQLDLREGIDLAIYLFGGFQKHVTRVSAGADAPVIFDVGANSGAITLALAKRNPRACIHSFEPTHFALAKLRRNLTLNPSLAERVRVNPVFVGSCSRDLSGPAKAHASWRVDKAPGLGAHPTHCGLEMDASPSVISLDDYQAVHCIPQVHMLKIDTDGHEMEVLHGARSLIKASRPRIVMEMCPDLMSEQNLDLDSYADALGAGYRMIELCSGKAFDKAFLARVPRGGSVDVLAAPDRLAS